jgi:NitT/TauT family transport system substrate-binding protein
MNKRFLPVGAIVASAVLLLSGCGSTGSADPAPSASDGELRKVTVAALPLVDIAPLWAGVEAGIFEEHGLDVDVTIVQGGAQTVPALLNGDVQFIVSQPFVPIRADLQDLGVVLIGGYSESSAEGTDSSAVVASAAAGITRPAELAGRKVAVNSLGGSGQVTIMASVEEDGGDPDAIEFVEVAFPDVPAQLAAGTMDAAFIVDPFTNMLTSRGDTLVNYPQQIIPGLATGAFVTSQAIIDSDPQLVDDFSAAVKDVFAWAVDNEPALRQAIKDNLELPEQVADTIRLSEYSFELNEPAIKDLATYAQKYKLLDGQPNWDRLIQQY